MWNRKIPFKVDISGIIEIMGSSLYSRADTPIRELIQNAHDAVMRRRSRELEYQGKIHIVQDPAAGTITFSDDGIGLTPDDAEQYLGTLGVGITGMLKGRGPAAEGATATRTGDDLIGQFGIGLFSAFMLAERLEVESLNAEHGEAVRWVAGAGTDIDLSSCERTDPGTSITLVLKRDCLSFAKDADLLESAVKQYADFLPVPIYINDAKARSNVIQAAWFDATTEEETIELELASYFNEAPLAVIPINVASPIAIQGALYISPQRTPGFTDDSVVAATIRRMVISRQVQDLLPSWGSFLRGIVELPELSPTASREDLVRDGAFAAARIAIAYEIYAHLHQLLDKDPARLEAIVNWHRFTLAGSALDEEPLRELLQRSYRFNTSAGDLTFDEIVAASGANPLFDSDSDYVIWYNADRRQERQLTEIFSGTDSVCVHALRSFEESLLAAMIADNLESEIVLRVASPSSPTFAKTILGMGDLEDAPEEWQSFLDAMGATVLLASYRENLPVMAFLNERYELSKAFDELKKGGEIPRGFQRLIDQHFEQAPSEKNEVILNRNHKLVRRALEKGTKSPLANVARLLVQSALNTAGASANLKAKSLQNEDLDWIAEVLWGRE